MLSPLQTLAQLPDPRLVEQPPGASLLLWPHSPWQAITSFEQPLLAALQVRNCEHPDDAHPLVTQTQFL